MGRKRKTPRPPFGEWLRYLRSIKGLTQEEVERLLAEHTAEPNKHSHVISYWEGTGKLPGRDVLIALCSIYHCNLETLLGVKMTECGYEKIDSVLDCVRKANEQREKQIRETNKDPFL